MALFTATVGGLISALTVPHIVKLLFRLAIGIMVMTIVLLILPSWVLPPAFSIAVEWLVEVLWGFDFVLPVELMITLFFYALAIDIFFYSIRLFLWIKEVLVSKH